MGNSCTPKISEDEEKCWKQWLYVLQTLNFSRSDFGKLYYIFTRIDKDKSGLVKLSELLSYLRMDDSQFMSRAFSLLDEDRSGEIDFGEFVVALWTYCSCSKQSLINFAFELYDGDCSGYISKDELKNMMSDIFGSAVNKNKFASSIGKKICQDIDKADSDCSDGLSLATFYKITNNHKSLLFAVFELQTNIQKRVLGPRYWEGIAARKVKMPNGKEVTAAQFREQNLHKTLLKDYREDLKQAAAKAKSRKLDSSLGGNVKVLDSSSTKVPTAASASSSKPSTKFGRNAAVEPTDDLVRPPVKAWGASEKTTGPQAVGGRSGGAVLTDVVEDWVAVEDGSHRSSKGAGSGPATRKVDTGAQGFKSKKQSEGQGQVQVATERQAGQVSGPESGTRRASQSSVGSASSGPAASPAAVPAALLTQPPAQRKGLLSSLSIKTGNSPAEIAASQPRQQSAYQQPVVYQAVDSEPVEVFTKVRRKEKDSQKKKAVAPRDDWMMQDVDWE